MHSISPSARRMLGISLCSMLFGILLSMLGGRFYIRHLLSSITFAESPPVTAPIPSDPEFLTLTTAAPTEAPSQPCHILLIGQDRREGDTYARSDCMILCSFDPENSRITLTSFLRDLYVPIPGHSKNRLNAAYAFGGRDLLAKTLEENFGLPIDGCFEVDFSCFPEIIDLLGGVSIDLRQDEADLLGDGLAAGTQKLTGSQALSYARIRSLDPDGDFSRTERQRKLLISLMDAFRNASMPTLLRLAPEVLSLMTTDLSRENLLKLGKQLLPMLSSASVSSQHIPAERTYTFETVDGMSVLVPDLEAARNQIRETLEF